MTHSATRYELLQDLTDQWTVWDNTLQEPAMDESCPFAGLSFEVAETACIALNRSERSERRYHKAA